MDRRRRRWIKLSADFPFDSTSTRIGDKFGPVGVLLWAAYLTACKRGGIEGRITYASEEDGWLLLGVEPQEWTLAQFFAFTGRLKQTRKLRERSARRTTTIICSAWDDWNPPRGTRDGRDADPTWTRRGPNVDSTSTRDGQEPHESPGQGALLPTQSAPIVEPERESESENESESRPARNSRRNDIWDALVEAAKEPTTATARSNRGRCVKELLDAGATGEEVVYRAANYRQAWPGITLTDNALVKHWDLFAEPVQPGSPVEARLAYLKREILREDTPRDPDEMPVIPGE